MHEIPNAIVGRFQLFERLGKGGFGEVHRGYDPKLQREVAIKIVRPERADRARVLAEARTAAGLQHPNIVTIYEVDEADDTFFIVMELLHGQVLGRRLEGAPLALRLSWLQQLASALALAHSRGIVHRDVKPENVIVVDATSTIKLLDFGIAKRIEAVARPLPTAGMTAYDIPPTQFGHIKGTPRYLAPEILLGESVSYATDQWAWGVVAYLVLAGRHPSEVAGAPDGAAWAVTGDLVPLAQLATNAPPHVVATIMRALSKDPAARFPTMGELLAAFLGSEGPRMGDTRLSAASNPGPGPGPGTATALAPSTHAFDVVVSGAAPIARPSAPGPMLPPQHPSMVRPSHPQASRPGPSFAAPRAAAVAPRPRPAGGSGLSFVAIVVVAVLVVVAMGILGIGCIFLIGAR
ncbi:MAG: serine/threonine protein kinase [Deltaproteobacteria bacterium]|nr:serine/threonine protein kinase [Deltaproteobacteria bacterium]